MFEEPKDIFAGTDVPPSPVAPVAPAPPQASTIEPPPTQLPPSYGAVPQGSSMSPMKEGHSGGAFKVIFVVAIVVVILGISGFFAYRIMIQPADDSSVVDAVSDSGITDDSVDDADSDSSTATSTPTSTATEAVNPGTLLDSDGDGLTNARELEVGTSITKADTDGDGLGDREEVEVYGTDPRKADTDGDGYLDGQEVSGGYNPNGEGKLFTVPSGS